MIIYFSGTGNSRYVAEYISNYLKDEKIINSGEMIKNHKEGKFLREDRYVFVCPTYAWRIPKVFESFIRNAELEPGRKAYFIMTCGSNIGNAGDYLEKLSSYKSLKYMGISQIIMPENYIAMFPVPEEAMAKKIVQGAREQINYTARCIAEGKTLPEHSEGLIGWIEAHAVNPMFYKLFVKANKFYGTDSCIGCGKCVDLCPLNNIHMVDGKPSWGKNCTHCMACICRCPKEAIEYGKKSSGKNRYKCMEFHY